MSFLAAFVAVFATTYVFKKIAKSKGFLDKPDERKAHKGEIPPIGGIALFAPFLILLLVFQDENAVASWQFYAAAALLLVTGFLDDALHINAKLKFLIHFIAAILIVLGGANLVNMGNLFGYHVSDFGVFAPIFSICCVVYLINAMNMIDGIDGLSGGLSLVATGFLALGCYLSGMDIPVGLYLLAGGLCAFLAFNMRYPFHRRATVFIGDAGSMTLGLVLAWYSMTLSQWPYEALAPISIAWILAVPIWDAFGLFSARLREGRHPFEADRRHLHHHFLEAGFTSGQATVMIMVYAAFLSAIGIFLPKAGVPTWVLTYLWMVLWLLHAQMSFKPNSFIRFLRRIHVRWFLREHPLNRAEQ